MPPVIAVDSILCGFIMLLLLTRTQTLPINNGFSVKFGPLLSKDEIRPKTFGSLFAKIPQDLASEATEPAISQAVVLQRPDQRLGCTNQIARLLYSNQTSTFNETQAKTDFLNVPILRQPFGDYKILIAVAPKNVKLTRKDDPNPVIVYVIFPDDEDDGETMVMPKVYFTNTYIDLNKIKTTTNEKEKLDPVLIVDSNRTVTGFKSTEMSKYIKFKSKLRNLLEKNVLDS